MSWITGFETSTALIGVVMFIVYLYLFIIERKKYIGIWALSWSICSLQHLFRLFVLSRSHMPMVQIGEALSAVWSSFFLALGVYGFLKKKMPKWWVFAWGILSAGIVISIVYQHSVFSIPVTFISVVYIWIGIMFYSSVNIEGAGRYLTGIMFILWGIHVLDYPFLGQNKTFVPIGYLIGNILLILAAFGILLTYFEKTRNDLKRSEQHLRIITDNMTDMIIKTDPKGIFQYASPSTKELLGYEPSDILGKSIFDLVYDDDIDMVKEEYQTSFNIGSSKRMEYRCRHAEGHYIWVEVISNPLFDEEQNLIGGTACIREITRRKRTEVALRESEERYRQVVEFFPDCIVVYRQNRIVFANTAAAMLVGIEDSRQLVGKPMTWYVHPSYKKLVRQKIKTVEKTGEPVALFEFKLVGENSIVIDIEAAATPILFDYGYAVLMIARDITERKKGEELRKKVEEKTKQLNEAMELDKLKTEFFANISHELRTPLNIILGTLQLFEMYFGKEHFKDHRSKLVKRIHTMKQNCYRLLRLINNLIDITKIDAGYFDASLRNYNIVSVVEEITLSIGDFIINRGIAFQFDTEVEEKIIACDPDKIERIILNLLSNAVKFTKPGGSIMVNIYDQGDEVIISVKDTGIGIPEDKLATIFERFRQVDGSLARAHDGSGIGLSLVKSLVEMHGGKVKVESEHGKGSEFFVVLPAKVIPEDSSNKKENYISNNRIEKMNIEFSDIYTQ